MGGPRWPSSSQLYVYVHASVHPRLCSAAEGVPTRFRNHVFFTDNLVRMLSKYEPAKMYYIRSPSESHWQNTEFSYGMAYGGGGFAISFPLAKALSKMRHYCLYRYPELFGSKNQGFHQVSKIIKQFDIFEDPLELMAAHPLTPLLSIHHLDVIAPSFPNMSKVAAVQRLMKRARVDLASILQQTILQGFVNNRFCFL